MITTKKKSQRVGFSAAGSVAAATFSRFLIECGFLPIGHDCSDRILMNQYLNHCHVSPPVSNEGYSLFLREFIETQCDLYVPFLDAELRQCAAFASVLDPLRVRLPISTTKAIDICNDKAALKEYAEHLGIQTVKSSTIVPAFIKPRCGSGGRQSLIVRSQALLSSFLCHQDSNEYIIESYMPGELVSVDCLFDSSSILIDFFCRLRSKSSGVSTCSTELKDTFLVQKIHGIIVQLGKSLGFYGMCSIQFFINGADLALLEVNPRMGGSAVHSHLLGSFILNHFFHMTLGTPIRKENSMQTSKPSKVARFYCDHVYN